MKKQIISMKDLCEGLSQKFAVYFDHVYLCDFDNKPQYAYLYKIFCALFVHQGFNYDYVFN